MSSSPWYEATRDAGAIAPDVAERALHWLLALQAEDVTPETEKAWRRWRAEHPDHERAWRRIESVQGRLNPLASPFHAALARATLAPPRSEHRRRALKALAILVFAGGAAWRMEQTAAWRAWSSDYRTGVGQRRAVILADGTQLLLNTDSAVDIRFGDAERRVVLVAGEILVTTAPDRRAAARPFLVETAQGTVRALGTEYVVRLHGEDTEVSVFHGAVRIRPLRNAAATVVLEAGYRASYTAQAVTAPGQADDAGVAWKDGFVVARGMRLADLIAELGRYTGDALSCDPGVAGLRVSGSYPIGDIGKVLAALAVTLGLRIETQTPLWRRKQVRLAPARPAV